jgi:NAD(P)H-flavin reductase/ferredoxin
MTTYRVTVAPSGESFEVQDNERILSAGRRHGVWLPFECGWGSCGTCKVSLLEGEVALLFDGAPAVTPRDARRRRTVTCQATPLSDVVIRPTWVSPRPRPELSTADYEARLVDVQVLGPDIRQFTYELDRAATYRAGQYAVLELRPGLRRCFSMVGHAGSRSVEFISKQYPGGAASRLLSTLPLGTAVSMELPYGDMWIRPSGRPIFLVAGGTGISAVLALARQLSTTADPRPVRVFYGAASLAELVRWSDLQELVATLPDGRAHAALVTPGAGWDGTAGFVTDCIGAHSEGLLDAEVYLAGPPPMVDAVLALLREQPVPLDRVHYDRFG